MDLTERDLRRVVDNRVGDDPSGGTEESDPLPEEIGETDR